MRPLELEEELSQQRVEAEWLYVEAPYFRVEKVGHFPNRVFRVAIMPDTESGRCLEEDYSHRDFEGYGLFGDNAFERDIKDFLRSSDLTEV
jgi:hypothetical protein